MPEERKNSTIAIMIFFSLIADFWVKNNPVRRFMVIAMNVPESIAYSEGECENNHLSIVISFTLFITKTNLPIEK